MFPSGERRAIAWVRFAALKPIGPGENWIALISPTGQIPCAIVRKEFVADQTVRPEVSHFHLQSIRSRFQRSSDIRLERGSPKHTKIYAVDQEFGDHLNITEVQAKLAVLDQQIRWHAKGGFVAAGARKKLNGRISLCGPGDEPVDRQMHECARPGRHDQLPVPTYGDRSRHL